MTTKRQDKHETQYYNLRPLTQYHVYQHEGYIYTVSPKKVPTFKLSVTLLNLNLFLKFLHCWKFLHSWKRTKFAAKHIRHVPISPYVCCYTTLGN